MTTQPKIGIYGGTYDPIHFGHINLALELMETHHLDEVWFCPARINPLRQQSIPSSSDHRLNMVKLAIQDIPKFRMLDLECKREGPSYTIDTIKELINKEKSSASPSQFYLILGDDSVADFHKWKDVEEIINLVPLLIGERSSQMNISSSCPQTIRNAIEKGLTKTKIFDISSTEIRNRLKNKLYCGHLMPSKVIDYIYKFGLYF